MTKLLAEQLKQKVDDEDERIAKATAEKEAKLAKEVAEKKEKLDKSLADIASHRTQMVGTVALQYFSPFEFSGFLFHFSSIYPY